MMKRRLFKENRFLGIGFNPNHPLSSVANYIRVKGGIALKSAHAWGYPIHIIIEPVNLCNLKCPLCPTGIGTLSRPKGMMTLSQFQKIIDEIKGYVLRLEIAGMGEPFINPDLCRMIRYAVDAGIWVHLDTNVILINTEEKVRDLIDSGLGLLNMSIDGSTQETYEKYRVGGDLETVVRNLKAIIAQKRHRGVACPEIVCQVVVTRNNENEIDEIRRMMDALGVDRVVTKRVTLALVRDPRAYRIPEKLKDRFIPQSVRSKQGTNMQEVNYSNGCSALYKNAFIYWNGDVSTCCHDADGENFMGNIFEAGSFSKVWNSSHYRKLRHQVNTNIREAEPLCSICPNRIR